MPLRSFSGSFLALLCLCLPAALHAQDGFTPDVAGPTFTESVVATSPASFPYFGALIQASDGNFYALTNEGGINDGGAVIQVTPAGAAIVIHSFAEPSGDGEVLSKRRSNTVAVPDGSVPVGGLIQATDGYLYGTTTQGGSNGAGTVFKIQITSPYTETVMYSFLGGTDGETPPATVVQAIDGYLYGVASSGGANNLGTIFKLATGAPNTAITLHTFAGGATDGAYPEAPLVQASDGYLYGSALQGGPSNLGGVFKIATGGASTPVFLHFSTAAATDARYIEGAFIQATDGFLYNASELGGTSSDGTVFKMATGAANAPVLLYSFAGGTGGVNPTAGLVEATNGQLYGATYHGGANNYGTIFQISTGAPSTAVILHSFDNVTTDGVVPYAGLVQGSNGILYGTTAQGGPSGTGVIYKVVPSPALAAPVQLTVPATVAAGTSFSLSYLVANAYDGNFPGTLNYCFATNTAGDTTGWQGTFTGEPTLKTTTLTAPSTTGVYTYALTCGGSETGLATLNVTAPPPAAQLTFSSVTHNFGGVTDGATAVYGVTLTNTGTVAATGSGIAVNGSSEFTSATNCPASLAVGAHCQVNLTFAPATAGSVSAMWQVSGTAPGTTFVPSNGGTLSGSGTVTAGNVTLTSSGHNWGTVAVGTTSAAYGVVLTNATASPVTLSLGSVTAPFASATNCPATLAAGAACNLQFTFTPTGTGAVQQEYAVTANGGAVTVTSGGTAVTGVTLTGN